MRHWPSNNLRIYYENASILIVVDVDLENHVIPPYCDLRNMCPSLNIIAYTSLCDLFIGNFVFVWSTNLKVYPMWMGRAKSDVIGDQKNENYKKVYVQWWVFVKKRTKNDEELYHNCWLSN
jgi:hypothetical protein